MSKFKESVEKARRQKQEREESAFRTNTLLEKALYYLEHPTENEILRSIDMTGIFFEELEIMTKKVEYININVNGLPKSGKSTVGIALMIYAMKNWLHKQHTLWNISRDQTEYGRRIRENTSQTDTYMVIDEWNELETTGFNASKRAAYLETESDLFGQRDIRKIGCSPKNQVDKNAFIVLEVLQQDKDLQQTRCLLYYKVFVAGQEYQQLLGHVDVDVSDAMKDPIYAKYRKRKFERMDLILKEGVDSPEQLYQVRVIADVHAQMRNLARIGMVSRALIKTRLTRYAQEHKELLSILGKEDLIDTVKGILDVEKEHAKKLGELAQIKEDLKKKRDPLLQEYYENLQEGVNTIATEIKAFKDTNEKMLKLLRRYESMEE